MRLEVGQVWARGEERRIVVRVGRTSLWWTKPGEAVPRQSSFVAWSYWMRGVDLRGSLRRCGELLPGAELEAGERVGTR